MDSFEKIGTTEGFAAPGGRRQERRKFSFHDEYGNERMEANLRRVLEEYERRYKAGKNRLTKELSGNPELDKELAEFDEEYERLKGLAEEMAWFATRREKESRRDDISGLDNKAVFEEMYEFARRTLREREKLVLIAFDLDKFKDINETIGHTEADKILGKIGAAVKSSVRSDDFATRIGGDEFTIILNRVKSNADILQLAQRIGQKISQVEWTDKMGQSQGITFSAGYAVVEFGQNPFFEDIRKAADKPAGYSKRLGRNRLTVTEGEKFVCYELRSSAEGKKVYERDQEGTVAEMDKPNIESCFTEVVSNGQRIVEEIERFFDSPNALNSFIKKHFKGVRPAPRDIYDLHDRQKAELLLYVRKGGQ